MCFLLKKEKINYVRWVTFTNATLFDVEHEADRTRALIRAGRVSTNARTQVGLQFTLVDV